jgi:hypothetical protein
LTSSSILFFFVVQSFVTSRYRPHQKINGRFDGKSPFCQPTIMVAKSYRPFLLDNNTQTIPISQ